MGEMKMNNGDESVMNSVINGGDVGVMEMPEVEKKKVWPYVVIGILGVAVLVLAGLLIWALVKSGGDGVSDGADGEVVATEDEDVKEILAEAQKDAEVRELVSELKADAEKKLEPYAGIMLTFYDWGDLYYRPEGFATAIVLNKSYGFEVNPVTEMNNVVLQEKVQGIDWDAEFGRLLTEKGFVADEAHYTTASAWAGHGATYINRDRGIICDTFSTSLYLNCGATTWYDKADAELSNELAKLYEKAVGEDARLLRARVSAIKDSEVRPYQTIEVMMSGFGAMFYRVSPEAEWVYFDRGQAGPTCSQFNTEDLKKAFLGQACYSEEHGYDSKVEL